MANFLKVCLLLGVAAALIPSAFGRRCVQCGAAGGRVGKDCADYQPGDDSFVIECSSPYGRYSQPLDPTCMKTRTNNNVARGCGPPGKETGCEPIKNVGGVEVEICYCDNEDLCNKPPKDDGGRCNNGGSGQQLGLKGGSFGSLGMVLLGGVGLIRGQLWG